eukprot:COSAG02_NODE_619_length_19446_cov_9.557141_15_plen_48_part_00
MSVDRGLRPAPLDLSDLREARRRTGNHVVTDCDCDCDCVTVDVLRVH